MLENDAKQVIRFGTFEVDARTGEIRRNGLQVKLQDQPFQVLLALLEKPGDVVTREELRAKLWPADTFVDFDHSLKTAVKRLRDALGDTAENPRFIETLAKRGYRFLVPLHGQPVTQEPGIPKAAVPLENLKTSEGKGTSFNSPPMPISLTMFLATLSSILRLRAALQLENLALRHQIGVLSPIENASLLREGLARAAVPERGLQFTDNLCDDCRKIARNE